MKLIIAEKPSVRDSIAHTLGAYKKIFSDSGKSYCLSNDDYYVAAAAGHLYSLGEPTDYGYKKGFKECFESGELPMFPDFRIIPSDGSKEELRVFLNSLINKKDVDEIICATDAAREGELIFREIYIASGSTKPCKRFWVSSVTEEAIKDGMANLKPISEYDSYYYSAKARAELDWIFGMNLSRLYSVLDSDVRQVGRVMTPTLAIITAQDRKINDYKETVNYKLVLKNGAESSRIFDTREDAEKIKNSCAGTDIRVTEVTRSDNSENRPHMYSLLTLQQDMNALYGITASETLELAQSLYEKKFTTYPRTDGEYLTEDMKYTVSKTVEMLAENNDDFKDYAKALLAQGLNTDSRVINGAKINDHHAIIPTLQKEADISKLSANEKKAYDAVVNRFLMALDKKHTYIKTDYKFVCNDTEFELTVKKTVEAGWKAHKPKYDEEKEESSQEFTYSEGDTFSADINIKECKSSKPKHFTDSSLLSVMNNIDNRIDDSSLKEAVKGKGIGTSATRAEIIEKIIRSGYAERKDKYIISTQFGRDFITSLPAEVISAERTAEWEQKFSESENSSGSLDKIYSDTKQFVSSIVNYEKNNSERKKTVNPNSANRFEVRVVGKCPRCGEDIIDKGKFFGCTSYKDKDNKGCGFSFSKVHNAGWYKGEISCEQAEKLLKNEEISLKAVSSDGKEYPAKWHLEDDGKFINVKKSAGDKNVIGKCPWCGQDVVEGKSSYGCSSYKGKDEPGCGFVLWKEDKYHGITISSKNAASLISGKTISVKRTSVSGSVTGRFKLSYTEKSGKKYVNLQGIKDDE